MKDAFILYSEVNKKDLYQWDLNQKFVVADESICQAHYYSSEKEGLLVCNTYTKNGVLMVDIPNIILQKPGSFRVYAYHKDNTLSAFQFKVTPRPKPVDYIYTEVEVVTIKSLVEDALEEAKKAGTFDGEDGKDGKDGKSAYEIAVEHGFKGTEEEWLASHLTQEQANKKYVPQLPNNSTNYTAVYARYKNNGEHGTINATSSAIVGVIPLRAANGQIIAPNQSIYEPGLDAYISRRYLEAHAPGADLINEQIKKYLEESNFIIDANL